MDEESGKGLIDPSTGRKKGFADEQESEEPS